MAAGLIFSLAWLASSGPEMAITGSAPDLNVIREPSDPTILRGFKNTDGRTLSVQGLTAGQTTGVILCIGQSNDAGANYGQGSYSIVNTGKIDNLNLYDGAVYTAASPLLGGGGIETSWGIEAADLLVTAGWRQRVILANVSMSSTPVSDWLNTSPPGQHYHRIVAMNSRLNAKGLTPTVAFITIGESDAVAGTSQADMTSRLNSLVSIIRGFWPSVPIMMSKTSYYQGVTVAGITAAQQAVISGGTSIYLASTTDNYTAASRDVDDIHFNTSGMTSVATDFKNAVVANVP
jgi:lysophospholipase L1-like esterase